MDINAKARRPLITLIGILLGVYGLGAYGQSVSYAERQLSAALRETVKIGKAIDLKLDDESKFLAFYTEAFTAKSRGGVILIHGLDGHLDWPEIIHPLRTQLPKYGWNTLSLQLGNIGNFRRGKDYQSLYRDTGKRLAAAIDFLKQRGINNIVMVGHSLGASMALYHLANAPPETNNSVTAFAAISMYNPTGIADKFSITQALSAIKIPVLDILGALDSDDVLAAARKRKSMFSNTGNARLQQMIYSGGDHFLTGLQQTVHKHIRVWANKKAPGVEIKTKAGSKEKTARK